MSLEHENYYTLVPKIIFDTDVHFNGISAQIFQHEYDHLDGICFNDKIISESIFDK